MIPLTRWNKIGKRVTVSNKLPSRQLKGGDNRLEKGRTSTEIERVVYDVSKSTESAERDLGVKRRNRIKRRQKLKEKLYNINQAKKRLETPRKCSLPFRHPLICPNNIPVPFSDALFHIQGSATSKGSAHNTKEIKNVTSSKRGDARNVLPASKLASESTDEVKKAASLFSPP